MPITSSAKKALRASKNKRVFNIQRKKSVETSLKAFRKLVAAKDKTAAVNAIPSLYQSFDKAVKTGYIKANTASRMKSRAMASLKKIA
jgi:small subunit ribosomal protein S20